MQSITTTLIPLLLPCTAVWGLVLLIELRIHYDRRRRAGQHLDRQLLGRQLGRSLGRRDTGLPCREIVVYLSTDLTKTLKNAVMDVVTVAVMKARATVELHSLPQASASAAVVSSTCLRA